VSASELQIVEASTKDLEHLYPLFSRSLEHDPLSPDLLQQKLFFNPHPGRDVYHTLLACRSGRVIGAMQHVLRPDSGLAWLGLFAVDRDHRRQGVARRLLDAAIHAWRQKNVRSVEVMTVPTNYLVAGLDPRYTPAVCFIELAGFVQKGPRVNLRCLLNRDFDTAEDEKALAAEGIEIRRAHTGDWHLIECFFARQFGEGWLCETGLGMANQPPSVHLAIRDDQIIAFAAHSTMNQELGHFGPMGTTEACRGKGIGRILLFRCMVDLQAAGFCSAVIPWVGPYRFYCRLLDCQIERVLWQYRLDLPAPNGE
jgi:mycothiol synthase